jgi:hypothetical protein
MDVQFSDVFLEAKAADLLERIGRVDRAAPYAGLRLLQIHGAPLQEGLKTISDRYGMHDEITLS